MPFGWILVLHLGICPYIFYRLCKKGKEPGSSRGKNLWEIIVLLAIHSSSQSLMSRAKGFWLRPPLSKSTEKSTLSSSLSCWAWLCQPRTRLLPRTQISRFCSSFSPRSTLDGEHYLQHRKESLHLLMLFVFDYILLECQE